MQREFDIIFSLAQDAEAMKWVHAIRKQVFVVEQGIPVHREVDGFDGLSLHLLGRLRDGEAAAVARLTVLKADMGLLTRVAVLPAFRGRHLGQRLVEAVEALAHARGLKRLAVKPHSHVEAFYARLGYVRNCAPPDPMGGYTLVTMEKQLD